MTSNPNPGCARCDEFYRLLTEEERAELLRVPSEVKSVKTKWRGTFNGEWSYNGEKIDGESI